ncbi:MAG: peptidyl-prolyl cis-trans isomerase, partial [Bacteroidales bacterium]|nr:peptidyl-prolyl cis-trans isomerase [Bacteroidales bacterium]
QDYEAVKDLKPGEISKPVESLDNEGRDGNTIYKIVRLDKVLPAHTASFENDYTVLLGQVKQQKQMNAIDDFVKSKIKTTYIVIDPLFSFFFFNESGWSEPIRKD